MKLTEQELVWIRDAIYSHCCQYGLSGNIGNFYFEAGYNLNGGFRVVNLYLELGYDDFSREVDEDCVAKINNWLFEQL